ncbi:MAG: glycosyltransferase family 4 protein [Nocardioides sp.]
MTTTEGDRAWRGPLHLVVPATPRRGPPPAAATSTTTRSPAGWPRWASPSRCCPSRAPGRGRGCPLAPALRGALAGLPDGSTVLVDGLVGLGAGPVLADERRRLRVAARAPAARLAGADARHGPASRSPDDLRRVVTTSDWSRDWLIGAYGLSPGRVYAAPPAYTLPPPPSPAPTAGGCCASARSGRPRATTCSRMPSAPCSTCPGGARGSAPWTASRPSWRGCGPGWAHGPRRAVEVAGPVATPVLPAVYAGHDLLVAPTRLETYGMVVTEALAHGLPVVASEVGGVAEALGRAPDGARPGALVAAGDPAALARALRRWLTDAGWRADLRAAALARRPELGGWPATAAAVLAALRGQPAGASAAAPLRRASA